MDESSKRYLNAKTAVFWDVDGCQIPDGDSAIDVSQRIRSALVEKKYIGATTVYAYGDTKKIRESLKPSEILVNRINSVDDMKIEEIDYRGSARIYANQIKDSPEIVLNHTPPGDKDERLDKILIDLFYWAIDNPGSENLVIIIEDISKHHHVSAAINRLSLCVPKYNILLAQPKGTPPDQLIGVVSENFIWESLSSAGKFEIFPSEPLSSQRVDDKNTSSAAS